KVLFSKHMIAKFWYKNFSFFLYLFLFFSYVYSDVSKEDCEDWIIKMLEGQENSIKIYILENIKDMNLKKFYPEIKKLSVSAQNDNVRLKSYYVLYKVYNDTSSLKQIINFFLQKPKIDQKASQIVKAKFYLKNQLRIESAKMLAELGDEKIVDVLSKVINDDTEDGSVKDASYFALALLSQQGKIKPLPEIKEFFYSGLKDTDAKVRLQAVRYLGELKYQDSLQPLSLRLKDPNKQVVLETIYSLGKIGDISIFQELIQFKSHPEDSLRVALAESFGEIAKNILFSTDTYRLTNLFKIKNVLNEMLNDKNGMVRIAAARSLLVMKDLSGKEILKKGLESNDTDVLIYCIETFGQYGSKEDIKLLEPFVESQDITLKTAAYLNILKIYYRNVN
ncbi:MAG: HEAT repeat domain-containing protein, partial [Endomicrobiia bacterium]